MIFPCCKLFKMASKMAAKKYLSLKYIKRAFWYIYYLNQSMKMRLFRHNSNKILSNVVIGMFNIQMAITIGCSFKCVTTTYTAPDFQVSDAIKLFSLKKMHV